MNGNPEISWWSVASALAGLNVILIGVLWRIFTERFTKIDKKLNGIIMYLVLHADENERKDLRDLLIGN